MPSYQPHRRSGANRARRSRRRRVAGSKAARRPQASWNRLGRKAIVVCALVGALGLTTGLLSLLSPRPLAPDVSGRLFATGEAARALDFEPALRTRVPLRQGYWTGIVVRDSGASGGDATTVAEDAPPRGAAGPPDHFIIGNGRGMADGEVQFTSRWADQLAADAMDDGRLPEGRWISVCLIGDCQRQAPTEAQRARLEQLVAALRGRLGLPADRVVVGQGILAGFGRG